MVMSLFKPCRISQDTTALPAPWPSSCYCWQCQAGTQHCSRSPTQARDMHPHMAAATINGQEKKATIWHQILPTTASFATQKSIKIKFGYKF